MPTILGILRRRRGDRSRSDGIPGHSKGRQETSLCLSLCKSLSVSSSGTLQYTSVFSPAHTSIVTILRGTPRALFIRPLPVTAVPTEAKVILHTPSTSKQPPSTGSCCSRRSSHIVARISLPRTDNGRLTVINASVDSHTYIQLPTSPLTVPKRHLVLRLRGVARPARPFCCPQLDFVFVLHALCLSLRAPCRVGPVVHFAAHRRGLLLPGPRRSRCVPRPCPPVLPPCPSARASHPAAPPRTGVSSVHF